MAENNLIRSMVRGVYALQKLRIQMGNRITMNFKAKLGLTSDGMSEKELEAQEKKLLDSIRESYVRITDGIVAEGEFSDIVTGGKLPTVKKFKGDELISTYTELVLVDQYMTILKDEEGHFAKMQKVLEGIPIYDHFLSKVTGIGQAMSAVIISEIDIFKAEYPSSLAKYAGLDVVQVGKYTDDKGVEKTVRAELIDAWLAENQDEEDLGVMLAEGKYQVTITGMGRTRKDWALVKREYQNKEGVKSIRDSITFNPFLKTKLIGVLGPSFLRAGKIFVDGHVMGAAKRLAAAKQLGFDSKGLNAKEVAEAVLDYLKQASCEVIIERSKYGAFYYDYKNRLEQSPHHKEKTDLHRHNMAIRYMVKLFLYDLYAVWRELEHLVVAEPYSVRIGLVHGVATESKNEFFKNKNLKDNRPESRV